MFLHPHRADVLAALALAVDGQEPLPEAIERLGADDPLLAPWAARLAGPLREGHPLGALLRRHRLVTAAEAERIVAGDSLARLASGARRPGRGYALVRWLPVWFAAALVVPAIVIGLGISLLGAGSVDRIVRDMGVVNDLPTRLVHGGSVLTALAGIAVVVGGVAALQTIVRHIPFLRHALHLWCPEVHRAHLLLRMVRHARAGRTAKHWRKDWRAWLMLSRFRLRKVDRILLRQLPGLEQRLTALGLVPERDGRFDWDAAEAGLEERLATAIAHARPLLNSLLMLAGVIGSMRLFAWPMLRIIENISSSGL